MGGLVHPRTSLVTPGTLKLFCGSSVTCNPSRTLENYLSISARSLLDILQLFQTLLAFHGVKDLY